MDEGFQYDGLTELIVTKDMAERKTKMIQLGGLIGLGCDAGAFRVPHVEGTLSEEKWLRETLGQRTDAVLTEAEARVKNIF